MVTAPHELGALEVGVAFAALQVVHARPHPPEDPPGAEAKGLLQQLDVGVDVPGQARLVAVDDLSSCINGQPGKWKMMIRFMSSAECTCVEVV